jgi:hypothetical protein
MTTYTNPFTGQTINPAQVSYEALSLTANTTLQWPINGIDGTPASNIIDVTATANWLLEMPPATQVSTGQSVIVRNVGANTFTVTDNSGNTIVSVVSGVAQFILLTDNTTVNGTWSTFVFGAGTAAANAATLAGYGLTPIGLTLNQALNVTYYYSPTTLAASARAQFIVWASGSGALTLPSSTSLGNNWFVIIRNGGTGILDLTPAGTDTIDGNSLQQLQLTESLVLVSNGSTGFNTYAYGRSNQFAFTQLAQVVTGAVSPLTLTSAQGSNIIQEYSGVLTANQIVVLPSTVQLYSLQNNTTGAFSLTFKTAAASGATLSVAQGQTAFVVCDGTNVYSATSNTQYNFTTPITFPTGSPSLPSINFSGNTDTGMYVPLAAQIGWAISGTLKMTLDSTGLKVFNGISGGTF